LGEKDPNARNCHGYRKFVKRSVLENLNNGYLVNDTIVIRYTIELVVSTGGALTRQPGPNVPKLPQIQVLLPPVLSLSPRCLVCPSHCSFHRR
jgi:speckle-type POZ protein